MRSLRTAAGGQRLLSAPGEGPEQQRGHKHTVETLFFLRKRRLLGISSGGAVVKTEPCAPWPGFSLPP